MALGGHQRLVSSGMTLQSQTLNDISFYANLFKPAKTKSNPHLTSSIKTKLTKVPNYDMKLASLCAKLYCSALSNASLEAMADRIAYLIKKIVNYSA